MLYEYLVDISNFTDEEVDKIRDDIQPYFDNECSLKRKESVISKKILCSSLKSDFNLYEFYVTSAKSGKPYIEKSNIEFNISHSEDYVLLLIGDTKIGCDIEIIKDYKEKVAKRFFTENEYRVLENSTSKALDFTKIWTLKESILKYNGDGISGGLDKYDFSEYINHDDFIAYGLHFKVKSNNKYLWTVCFEKGEIHSKHYYIK